MTECFDQILDDDADAPLSVASDQFIEFVIRKLWEIGNSVGGSSASLSALDSDYNAFAISGLTDVYKKILTNATPHAYKVIDIQNESNWPLLISLDGGASTAFYLRAHGGRNFTLADYGLKHASDIWAKYGGADYAGDTATIAADSTGFIYTTGLF